jgi:hypothetical protein
MKLKHSEIKTYRQLALAQQHNCCALCGEPIVNDAVLDHDHKSGLVRRVLHRGCNTLLGKIENNMLRSLVTMDRLRVIAQNLVNYMQQTHTDMIHPTHKTPEERALRAKKRRKLKNASKKSS